MRNACLSVQLDTDLTDFHLTSAESVLSDSQAALLATSDLKMEFRFVKIAEIKDT